MSDCPRIIIPFLRSFQNFHYSIFPNSTRRFSYAFPDGHASLLNVFFNSSPKSCHALPLCPFGNSHHVLAYVDISFRSLIKQEESINRISFYYQLTDWKSFLDFLHDAPWNYILNHPAEKCATKVSF